MALEMVIFVGNGDYLCGNGKVGEQEIRTDNNFIKFKSSKIESLAQDRKILIVSSPGYRNSAENFCQALDVKLITNYDLWIGDFNKDLQLVLESAEVNSKDAEILVLVAPDDYIKKATPDFVESIQLISNEFGLSAEIVFLE